MKNTLAAVLLVAATSPLSPVTARAGLGLGNGHAAPPPPPPPAAGPASSATSDVIDGQLRVGAGGVFSPEPVHNLLPSGVNPTLGVAPVTPGFVPGALCPPQSLLDQVPTGVVRGDSAPGNVTYTEYPTLHDGETGHPYATWPNGQGEFSEALGTGGAPPGPYQAVTTAGVWASDGVAVTVWVTHRGSLDAQGNCQGLAVASYDLPYDVGPLPPPAPPATVLTRPPFNPGQLATRLKQSWTIGAVATAPGPDAGNAAYVRAPTCAWISGSTVPATGATFHAYTQTTVPSPRDRGAVLLTLNYTVQVTPETLSWDFGDGDRGGSAHEVGRGSDPGSNDPHFNYTSYSWDPGGCSVYHLYGTAAAGPTRTISATQGFLVTVSVTWSDGTTTHGPQPVPCDPRSGVPGQPCEVTVGPGDGWSSPGHRVTEVAGVPYSH